MLHKAVFDEILRRAKREYASKKKLLEKIDDERTEVVNL